MTSCLCGNEAETGEGRTWGQREVLEPEGAGCLSWERTSLLPQSYAQGPAAKGGSQLVWEGGEGETRVCAPAEHFSMDVFFFQTL